LLARRQARARFIDFAQYVDDLYEADPFHEALGAAFDKVVAGQIKRLIINAPPQHGKSRATSEILPAYWLGQRPNHPVIIASYGAELAETKSREARRIVNSEPYINLFGTRGTVEMPPVYLSPDSAAVYEWRLAAPWRGGVRAAGVGGGLTGFPGKLGIIDDPVKDMKEAQSALVRQSVWDWYRSVFRTRMNKGSAIIIIMTRWHPEDLVGKLLDVNAEQDDLLDDAERNGWTVLRFPAIAETQAVRDENNKLLGLPSGLPDPIGRAAGEPLAPGRFEINDLLDLKHDLGDHIWSAAYDNVPRLREGNMFQREWFQSIAEKDLPRTGRRIRYWDKAGTKHDGGKGAGAATAGVLIFKSGDNYYIEHVVRGWYDAGDREDIILATARADAKKYGRNVVVTYIEQEPGSGGKESAATTIKNLSKEGFSIKRDIPSGDKNIRLDPMAAQAKHKHVYLVEGAWNTEYVDEMIAIPNGARRDQGDASSGAFNMLNAGAGKSSTKSKVSGLPGRGQRQAVIPRR
jgi:predicted phage terminase large subunit-like protein